MPTAPIVFKRLSEDLAIPLSEYGRKIAPQKAECVDALELAHLWPFQTGGLDQND